MTKSRTNAVRILSLFTHEHEDILSKDEYAWLAERGFVKTCGDYNSNFKTAWQVVVFADPAIQEKLLQLGETVKAKHITRFEQLKKPYSEAVLQTAKVQPRNQSHSNIFGKIFHRLVVFLPGCALSFRVRFDRLPRSIGL